MSVALSDERYEGGAGGAPEGARDPVRQQLARELHDSVVQTLQLMLVEMERFKHEQFDPGTVVREVNEYQAYTREVLNDLREVLYELRDETAVETGFTEGLRALVANFERRSGIRSRIWVSRSWPNEIHRGAANNLRRIIEEGLNNVRRHSQAPRCVVSLGEQDVSTLLVQIRDNGIGIPAVSDMPAEGLGLRGIRERVLLLGGRLSVSSKIGGGTVIRAAIPREFVA